MKKNRNKSTSIVYWVSGFSLLISIIALCGVYVFKGVVVEKESVVLLFVGFLTTFIVIGNYAQVKSIEQDFSQKVGELKHEFSEKIRELNKDFYKKVLLNQTLSIIQELYKKMDDALKNTEPLIRLSQENAKGKEQLRITKEKIQLYSDFIDVNKIFIHSKIMSLFEGTRDKLNECIKLLPEQIELNKPKDQEWEKNGQLVSDKINNICNTEIPEIRKEIDLLFRNTYGSFKI